MEKETYEQFFEMAEKRKDFVTPLLLDYYRFESLGISEKGVVNLIKNKYDPILS